MSNLNDRSAADVLRCLTYRDQARVACLGEPVSSPLYSTEKPSLQTHEMLQVGRVVLEAGDKDQRGESE